MGIRYGSRDKPKHPETDPYYQLLRWLIARGRGSSSELAERCNIGKARISQIINNRSRPGIDLALAIERETGIDAALFQPVLKRARERT